MDSAIDMEHPFQPKDKQRATTRSLILHCVVVLIALAQIVADTVFATILITGHYTVGRVLGAIMLCAVLLPGLTYQIGAAGGIKKLKNEIAIDPRLLMKLVLGIIFPLRLLRNGILGISSSKKRNDFLKMRKHQCLIEGAVQTIIVSYIMLIPRIYGDLSVICLVFAVTSVISGYYSLHNFDKNIKVFIPGRALSAFSIPTFIPIILSSYPVIFQMIRYLFRSQFQRKTVLLVEIVLISLYVALALGSLSRLFLVFVKRQRCNAVEDMMYQRHSMQKSRKIPGESVHSRLPADLFWSIKSKRNRSLYLLSIILSNTVLIVLNILTLCVGDFWNSDELLFLVGCLSAHVLDSIVTVIYFFKPKLFLVYHNSSIIYLELGEAMWKLMHAAHAAQENGDYLKRIRTIFEELYYDMQRVHLVCPIEKKFFEQLINESKITLQMLQNANKSSEKKGKNILLDNLEMIIRKMEDLKVEEQKRNDYAYMADYVKKVNGLIQELHVLIEPDAVFTEMQQEESNQPFIK